MLIARILSLVSFTTSLASLVTKIAGHVDALTKPSITLPGGEITITGITDGLVDSFYGVPFAAPPIGDLRFQAPQDLKWNTSHWNASRHAPACIQSYDDKYAQFELSEDCLYLDIHVPKGDFAPLLTLPAYASKPIQVDVRYGGSWVSGASSFYDGTFLVNQSIQSDQPVIFISTNCRVGAFGFLNGPEAAREGIANLGIRDVIKSLEWVKENIQAFGGDPERVTVFGESAGSMIISYLYLQPHLALFKGAIMQSGSPSSMPMVETAQSWRGAYIALFDLAGCAIEPTNGTRVDCLRSLPAEEVLLAQEKVQKLAEYQGAFIFMPSIDGQLIPDSPAELLSKGRFANIPYISGNMEDEGTYFVPEKLPEDQKQVSRIYTAPFTGWIPDETLETLFTILYPDIPALGSPFDTGNDTFGLPSEYKQLAALTGDTAFQAPRRNFLRESIKKNHTQSWSYRLDTVLPTFPARYGAFHSADIPYTFGLPRIAHLNMTGERAEYAASFNFTEADATVSKTLMGYWINFAHNGDPNGPVLPSWPTYGDEANIVILDVDKVKVEQDDFRREQIDYFIQHPEIFNY